MRNFVLAVGVVFLFSFFSKLAFIDTVNRFMFDEDYHVLTAQLIADNDERAFQWWHQPLTSEHQPYLGRPSSIEWLHPPVAKYLQAITLSVFGDTPMGWRMSSVLAGVGVTLMVVLISYHLTQNQTLAVVAGLLSSVDGLVFVQSRLASNDIHLVFFVLLSGWLFLKSQEAIREKKFRIALWLTIATGISAGLSLATKWPGGLVGVFFVIWNFMEIVRAKTEHRFSTAVAGLNQVSLIGFCMITVYILSYLPALISGGWQHVAELHQQAWRYQKTTTFEHKYASTVPEWVLNVKPVRYYYEKSADSSVQVIYNLGNPVVHWVGIISLVLLLGVILKSHSKNKHFSEVVTPVLLWSTFVVPWLFISRPTFFYHYIVAGSTLPIAISVALHYLPSSLTPTYQRILTFTVVVLSTAVFLYQLPILTGAQTGLTKAELLQHYFWIETWW